MFTLFQGKRGLNYAVHAAAQQTDMVKLGVRSSLYDPVRTKAAALQYLRENLKLDVGGDPLPGTFLRSHVEVLAFEVVNEDRQFLYTYMNEGVRIFSYIAASWSCGNNSSGISPNLYDFAADRLDD